MRALPSHFANTCTFGRRLAKSYCYYLSSYHILGGRAYPVRHYPIAVRLRTLAFGNMVAMIVDPVNIRATCASALPTHSRSSYLPSVERLFCGDPIKKPLAKSEGLKIFHPMGEGLLLIPIG